MKSLDRGDMGETEITRGIHSSVWLKLCGYLHMRLLLLRYSVCPATGPGPRCEASPTRGDFGISSRIHGMAEKSCLLRFTVYHY